jgi:hypothetical protein
MKDDDPQRLERALRKYPPEEREAWILEIKRLAEIVEAYLEIKPKRLRGIARLARNQGRPLLPCLLFSLLTALACCKSSHRLLNVVTSFTDSASQTRPKKLWTIQAE